MAVVQAARVSYGEGTRRVSDDRGLIRYLMRHRHTTPFEMVGTEIPGPRADGLLAAMDSAPHGIVNEYSTRYSRGHRRRADDARRRVARARPSTNRQGSGGLFRRSRRRELTAAEARLAGSRPARVYQERIERGVAREQARKDLPLSTYTEAYWKIDLHNLLHFLALRMDAHAQKEIRAVRQTHRRADRRGRCFRWSGRRFSIMPEDRSS